LIDGGGKAGEVGLACGLLNRMNKKNVVPTPRTMEGQVDSLEISQFFPTDGDEGQLHYRLFD
jgi:pentatricopeptide repeat protein